MDPLQSDELITDLLQIWQELHSMGKNLIGSCGEFKCPLMLWTLSQSYFQPVDKDLRKLHFQSINFWNLDRSKTHWDHRLLSYDALYMLLECFQRSGVTAGRPRRGRKRRRKPPRQQRSSVQRRSKYNSQTDRWPISTTFPSLLLLSLGSCCFLLLFYRFAFLQKKIIKKRH